MRLFALALAKAMPADKLAWRPGTVADLETSFAHLKATMQKTTVEMLSAPVDMFGQKWTQQSMWILTTTHLHEHLGQAIAYARMNGVVPPWSK